MNQDEINQAEWNDRNNWTLFCYHSQRDSRFWVPKRCGWGWTINLRTKAGAIKFVGSLVGLALIGLMVAIVLPMAFHRG